MKPLPSKAFPTLVCCTRENQVTRKAFQNLDLAMHLWGVAILWFFAVVVPGEFFLPPTIIEIAGDPKLDLAPIPIRILLSLLLFLMLAPPALWILMIQLNRRQTGAGIIGGIIVAVSALSLLQSMGLTMPSFDSRPDDAHFALVYGVSSMLSLLIGIFVLTYARIIYQLPIPHSRAARRLQRDAQIEPTTTSAVRQLAARLTLFLLTLAIASGTTIFLSSVESISPKLNPLYVFFGITILGMYVSGVISEELLKSLIPWYRPSKQETE